MMNIIFIIPILAAKPPACRTMFFIQLLGHRVQYSSEPSVTSLEQAGKTMNLPWMICV